MTRSMMRAGTVVAALVCALMLTATASVSDAKIGKDLKEELQPKVEKGLESDDPLVKSYAILAAGQLGDRTLDKRLKPFLGSTNVQVRRAAIVALASRKDRDGLKALQQEIVKAGGGAEILIGQLVSQFPEKTQVSVFKDWMTGRNTDPKVRKAAMSYVARFARGDVYNLMGAVTKARKTEDRKPYLDLLLANPRKAAAPWAKALLGNRRDADARLGGLKLAMAIGGAEVDPIIRSALKDSDARISAIALDYLAEAGDPSAGEFLIARLASGQDSLKTAKRVLELRLKVPYDVASKALSAAGDDKDAVQTFHAILGASQDPKAVETLAGLEGSTVVDERRLGIIGLSHTRSPKAAAILERTAFDGYRDVQILSIEGLGLLGFESSVDVLYKAFNNARSDKEVRTAAVTAMGLIKSPKAAQKLSFWIRDRDPQIKLLAVKGLANIGDKSAISMLSTVIDNERDEALRFDAFMIVLKADADAALKRLSLVIQRPPEDYIDRFSELPSAQREVIFTTLLKSDKDKVRQDALDGLTLMGESGLSLLRKATTDAFPKDVRDSAIDDLSRHNDPVDTNLFKRLAQAGTDDEKMMAIGWLIRGANADLAGFCRTLMNGAKTAPVRQMVVIYALFKASA